ncbi:MAG: 4-hydroxythreonine-4-phosphate dehydrogenase PdxA [Burkholderiales bacterium]|nr:MAG: 4-hydroxythreonine-4-phosphate dehydrogenase PdxA [Burkholderiales bacterium]
MSEPPSTVSHAREPREAAPPGPAAPGPKPLAITMGDAAGIGPEIVLRALADPELPAPAVVIGDASWRAALAARLCLPLAIRPIADPQELPAIDAGEVPVLEACRVPPDLRLGRIDARAGRAAADCIELAIALALERRIDAIVTAPIHKEALAAAGLPFPGHTEMLAALAGVDQVRMMLVNDELRTILVSIHVSLADAIRAVTRERVLETIRIADAALRRAGVARPRIAVAGLNPHAGEGGMFGREEIDAIAPAVADARGQGIDATGPWPGDTVFMRARGFSEFDLVVAQYHDQGLIPIKYLGLERGVNVTVGLPFVRTSVDHGTAFDIAGKGIAEHRSLLAACRAARQLAGNR